MVFLQIRKKQSHFNSGEKYLSNRNRDMWKLYIYKKNISVEQIKGLTYIFEYTEKCKLMAVICQ